MKRFFFVLAACGLALGYSACERQSWEETRTLHLKHEGHGDGEHSDGVKADADKKAH